MKPLNIHICKLRTISRIFLLFTVLSLPEGCSFIPQYKRPPLPTATSYNNENGSVQTHSNVSKIPWKDFFTDPFLQNLIELAIENNRDLKLAVQRIEEARAIYGISKADLFPDIKGNVDGMRIGIPKDLTLPGYNSNISLYATAINISSWELDFWGRIRSLKEASLENYLATEEARRATLISLINQVVSIYLVECATNELLSITKKTIASREESYNIINHRFEEGAVSKFDAIQAETLLLQARSDWTVLERTRKTNWNAMTLLVGTSIASDNKELSQIEPFFNQQISPGLPSDLLYNRPDILAAEHKLLAANANIGAAKAAFFPRIALTGMLGSASNELTNLFNSGNLLWSFAPNITIPIFNGGRLSSNLDLSKIRKNIAITEYEHCIQIAFKEVADALVKRKWYAEQVDIQKQALSAHAERKRLAEIRYQNGASAYLEVLDAERTKFLSEQYLVETRAALLTNYVNLYSALGGGSFCIKNNSKQ